ncbi:MAG TPA: ParA family protein [Nevskiales bacterium]|nr:ParA family protein [Nevskiales bacterium]
MRRIVVINSKGGCGKTTVATNLASYYAGRGLRTALFDYDPQGSSLRWLKQRPRSERGVFGVAAWSAGQGSGTRAWQLRVPPETERIVADTPAALNLREFGRLLPEADAVLVPVTPSPIDMFATANFIRDLLLVSHIRVPRERIAIVPNRAKANTLSLSGLERFLATLNITVLGALRDTQRYVYAAEQGLGVHELKGAQDERDLEAWRRIFAWLESDLAEARPAPNGARAGTIAP